MRVPNRLISSEFVANTRATWLRSLAVCLLSLLAGGAYAIGTTSEVENLQQRWDTAVNAGRFTLVVSAAEGAQRPLTAAACDALNTIVGVQSAGGIMTSQQVTPIQHPVLSYRLNYVTPGYVRAMWPGRVASAAGAYVGSYVAERLGVVNGSSIDLAETEVLHVAGVLPASNRDTRLDRDIIVPTLPTGEVRSCIVDVDPRHYQQIEAAIRVRLMGVDPAINPILRTDVTDSDPEGDLRSRASNWGWLVVAALAGGVCTTIWWARRAEFALYRLLGATRPQVLYLLTLEAITFILVPAQLGFLVAIIGLAPSSGAVQALLAIDNARMVLAISLVPLLGLALLRPSRTLDTLKGA